MSGLGYIGWAWGAFERVVGPLPWVVVALALATALSCILAWTLGARRNVTAARAAAIVPPVLLALLLLACAGLVSAVRQHVIDAVAQRGAYASPGSPFQFRTELTAWLLGAGCALLLAPPVFVACCAPGLRRSGPHRGALVIAIVAASGLVLTTVGVVGEHALGLLAETQDVHAFARRCIAGPPRTPVLVGWAVASVLAVVAAVRLHRRGARVGRGSLTAAACVAAVGLGAFVATRPLAHDAAHPLPLRRWSFGVHAPELPVGRACRPAPHAPLLRIDSTHALTLDERRVDLQLLRSDLATLRRNWHILHPGRSFPGVLLVVAPDAVMDTAVPVVLRMARRQGFDRPMRLYLREHRFATDTLGTVVRDRPCVEPLGPLRAAR